MHPLAVAAHGNAPLLVGLALAASFVAIAAALPASARERALPALSLAAAVAYFRSGTPGFLLDIAIAYAIVRWLASRRDAGLRWRAACVSMILLAIVFTAGRLGHASAFLLALDMWLVLRLVTLVWEVGSGLVCVPSPRAYITWICLPVTLVGPVLRYSEFTHAAVAPQSRWAREMATALGKMAIGIALSAADLAVASGLRGGHPAAGAVRALVTGPLGFYLTLAGYYHAMQALGARAGIALPDSFNWPIGRVNIGEFWGNWNMSATRVFRDYLFYNRWGRGTYNIFLNALVLFTLVGVWHGANAYWVIFGMLHGLLFCAFLLWRRYRGELEGLPLRGTAAARLAARAVTYVAVCACWYLPTKIVIRLGGL